MSLKIEIGAVQTTDIHETVNCINWFEVLFFWHEDDSHPCCTQRNFPMAFNWFNNACNLNQEEMWYSLGYNYKCDSYKTWNQLKDVFIT